MPAASLSYSASPQVYTVGVARAPLVPTMVGSLSAFTVSPGLPAGLALDANSGVISGTPTAVAAQALYTIRAVSSSGTVTASVTIAVDAAATISYGASAFSFTVGVAARTLTATVTGGSLASWSISPALPAGLTFSPADGHIAGTATAASAATAYVITGVNSGAQSSVMLTIAVDSNVLVELGHVSGLTLVRFSGSRVISLDGGGHWVLWDYAAAAILARGDTGCLSGGAISSGCGLGPLIDVIGPTAVIRTPSGFEVHSSADGHLLSTITASGIWWKLASDGSYIIAGSRTALVTWSAAGQMLWSRPGDYSGNGANVFAASGAARVAAGPAGAVVETVSVPGGTVSPSAAYNGQFSSWFLDGNRFVTVAGATALVYSLAVVQEAAVPVPASASVTGQGNYVWTFPNSGSTLNVYAVGPGTTPVASYAIGSTDVPVPSAMTIGVLQYGRGLSVIDLSGAAPVKADYTLPVVNFAGPPTFAATSASQWVLGNERGVLFDGASVAGTPRYLALGGVSIAGSTGHIAIATASGMC